MGMWFFFWGAPKDDFVLVDDVEDASLMRER